MNSSSGQVRREDVVLAVGYAALAWLLHSVNLSATGQPLLPWLAPWWPVLAVVGCASVVLRRSRPALMVPVCTAAAVALTLAGSAAGFFLAFEAVFSLVLFGSAKAARAAEVSVLLLSAAAGIAVWAVTGNLGDGVVSVLFAGMILLLPAEWAGNLRKAGQLAVSESARAAAIRQTARDHASLAAREHELALAAARQDMARELHDVLSSRLSAIALQSGAALRSADGGLAREVLGHVRRESVEGLEELNSMIRMLSTGEPRPLAGRVEDLDAVVEAHRAAGLDIEWENRLSGSGRLKGFNAPENEAAPDHEAAPADEVAPEDEAAPLSGPVQAAIYRIATEALVNAGRHAPGARVRITLEQEPAAVRLAVADDGGLPPRRTGPTPAESTPARLTDAGQAPTLPSSPSGTSSPTGIAWAGTALTGTGTGIPSMLARAEQLGGTAWAGPRDGGWTVEAVLPAAPVVPPTPDLPSAPVLPSGGPPARHPASAGPSPAAAPLGQNPDGAV